MKKNYKRRNYFIKKGFQGKYIFQFYALIAIGGLLFTLFFALTTAETLTIIYDNYDIGIGSTPFILIKELIKSNWLLLIPIGFIVAALALFHTHRIAGPLHKFEMVLKDMQEGILDPNCRLRAKDDAQEVMEELQKTNRFFADKINELQEISAKLNEMKQSDAQSTEAIANEAGRLQTILDGFTIKE